MSANPNNAGFELTLAHSRRLKERSSSQDATPGREALQALLAFSSLHEQIREHRSQQAESGVSHETDDPRKAEQFVLDEVLHLVAERAMAITGADGVAIALAEEDAIICRASVGSIVPDPGANLNPNSEFSGACFRTGKIVRCDDSETDPRVNVQTCRRLGTRSMVAVPLVGQQNILGLLEAFSTEAFAFNDSDVRSLTLLAELILAAIKPEEEGRLSAISRQVVAQATDNTGLKVATSEAAEDNHFVSLPESTPSAIVEKESIPSNNQSEFFLYEDARTRFTPGLVIVLLLVLLATLVGAGVWWKIRHSPKPTFPVSTQNALITFPSSHSPAQFAIVSAPKDVTTVSKEESVNQPGIIGIRHWSAPASSTVVVDLQDQVQYEAHRLTNPDRIYFDFDEASLAPALIGKSIEINDAFLDRVRIAQPVKGVIRVVLETKAAPAFSVSLEQNPYRLVVEVHHPGSKTQPRAKIDLFSPETTTKDQFDSSLNAPRAQTPKFRIVLDAGHGGWDLGTVGRKGLLEKDLVLDIIGRLGKLVENRLGAEVLYTRKDDTYISLEKRAEIANLTHADLFLSVHANYSDYSAARGVETYYTNTYSSIHARTSETDVTAVKDVDWTGVDIREKVQESHKFAANVQHALYGTLAAKNPELRDRGVKKASYVVLTGTTMPAILAEVSFISSPSDELNLESVAYRQQIAEALYKGIARYSQDLHRVKIASTF
jgi:N-acetylmuramoyl-L-alanine amidase